MEIVFSKVAGIDVHRRQVTVAVRVPDDAGDSGGEPRAQKVPRRRPPDYATLPRSHTPRHGN